MKTIWAATCIAALCAVTSAGASAQEATYRQDVKPLFERLCAGCHGGGAAPYYGEFSENQKAFAAARVDLD